MEKTTNTLNNVLKKTKPDQVGTFLENNQEELIVEKKPFARYMRMCIRERGMQQQEVFIRADLSESYGYKIISEEKHTNQRDTIIRLCIGAKLSLEETQRALKIYGMSPLYSRIPREAAIIVALNNGMTDVEDVNTLLKNNNMIPLKGTES